MNPEVKAKWVKALRSGQYRQAREQLRTSDNAFCCLGVLCNVHAQQHPEVAAKQRSRVKYLGHDEDLPEQLMEWAGIDGYEHDKLVFMNDSDGASFQEIADYIEREL